MNNGQKNNGGTLAELIAYCERRSKEAKFVERGYYERIKVILENMDEPIKWGK